MASGTNVGRRQFLGIGLGALAGAGAAGGVAWALRPRAKWSTVEGFPDCPVPITVEGSGPAPGAAVEVELRITTPREEIVNTVHGLRASADGSVVVPLRYPYEVHVNGRYHYHAVIRWEGREVLTQEAASYDVRPTGWFA